MALIKFLTTALVATLMFTMSVLANPVPALTAMTTTTETTANHLEKRVCNEYGCGLKCKGTVNTPCSHTLNSFKDCDICSYFEYAANGSAVSSKIPIAKLHWTVLLIMIYIDPSVGCAMPLHPVGQLATFGSVLGAQLSSIHPTRAWRMLRLSKAGMESMLLCRSRLLAFDARAVDSCTVESSRQLR